MRPGFKHRIAAHRYLRIYSIEIESRLADPDAFFARLSVDDLTTEAVRIYRAEWIARAAIEGGGDPYAPVQQSA